jgi:hypothetical protein
MVKYILRKGRETVEVLEGREARRDQLIAAGYEWVNKPEAQSQKSRSPKAEEGQNTINNVRQKKE